MPQIIINDHVLSQNKKSNDEKHKSCETDWYTSNVSYDLICIQMETKWAHIYVNIKMAIQKTTTPYILS